MFKSGLIPDENESDAGDCKTERQTVVTRALDTYARPRSCTQLCPQ